MKEKKEKNKKACSKTYIGGQAVLEGVMMRGKLGMATAVRDADGVIRLEAERLPQKKRTFTKLPVVRGAVNFFTSMYTGMKILMRSAEVYGEDTSEPGKFEKWLAKTFKVDVMSVVMTIGVILGLAFSIGLFFILPNFLGELLFRDAEGGMLVWRNVFEGLLRVAIFVAYILLTSLMKDIRRTYMYHGAEHKTITCYEKGLPLTVENVRSCRRVHDRCGTTFMFFVMFVSIFVFSVFGVIFPWLNGNAAIRIAAKIALLPLVAGISYELLKALAKTDSPIVFVFKIPGLLLQKLTTREPDDEMIEVAITSFEKVLKMDADPEEPTCAFVCPEKLKDVLARVKKDFAENSVDESDAEWIACEVTGLKRSDLGSEKKLGGSAVEKINKMAAERLSGRPLWYIVGNCDFCGVTLDVDERVLIPRPETEELACLAAKCVGAGDRVLDLCTGSGAIAAYLAKNTEAEIFASDVSEDALDLAKHNFEKAGVVVTAIRSDLFSAVEGKFDLIVCNPPYIKSGDIASLQREVRDFEPIVALDGGQDGLDFYRAIAALLPQYLNEKGKAMFEVGYGQAGEVAEMLRGAFDVEIIKDMQGVDRIVKAELK